MNSTPAPFPRLLGDIGGSNARFAMQSARHASLSDVATLACKDHAGLEEAIRHYLMRHPGQSPASAAFGVADDASGDRVRLTNYPWEFSVSALCRNLKLERLVVVNDFTALALGLPALSAADLHAVGSGKAVAGAPRAVLGPGTGLGVSGLITLGEAYSALQTQGGHVSLAPDNAREASVIQCLHDEFGHASAERVLSGPGLVNLHRVLARLDGVTVPALQPADIVALGRNGSDERCARVLDLFFAFLGSVAGNLALTLGALGGVYIGGGIVPRMIPELERSGFRERFESKGRFRAYLQAIPTLVIVSAESPALLGASRALDQAG